MTSILNSALMAILSCIVINSAAADNLDPKLWGDLMATVINKGQVLPLGDSAGIYLARGTSFDEKSDRDVKYFTVVGLRDEAGNFMPQWVSLVEEQWRQRDGFWYLEQQIRNATISGRLYQLNSSLLVFDQTQRLIDLKGHPTLAVTHPSVINTWQSDLSDWAEFARVIATQPRR